MLTISLDPELQNSLIMDQLRIKVHKAVPADAFIVIGWNSASVLVDGKVRSFRWDETRFMMHGLLLEGLHETTDE